MWGCKNPNAPSQLVTEGLPTVLLPEHEHRGLPLGSPLYRDWQSEAEKQAFSKDGQRVGFLREDFQEEGS